MSKRLKNTTGALIEVFNLGELELPIGDVYVDLTIEEYLDVATDEVVNELSPLINAGDVIVNDGVNDLAPTDGIRFLRYADRAYIQRYDVDITRVNRVLNFEGSIQVVDEGDGKATISLEASPFLNRILTHFRNEAGTSIANFEECSNTHIPAGPYVVIDLSGNLVISGES